MRTVILTESELLRYRDACEQDESRTTPGVPGETYRVMNCVLNERGLTGFAEKVTASFGGQATIYELHYSET